MCPESHDADSFQVKRAILPPVLRKNSIHVFKNFAVEIAPRAYVQPLEIII